MNDDEQLKLKIVEICRRIGIKDYHHDMTHYIHNNILTMIYFSSTYLGGKDVDAILKLSQDIIYRHGEWNKDFPYECREKIVDVIDKIYENLHVTQKRTMIDLCKQL